MLLMLAKQKRKTKQQTKKKETYLLTCLDRDKNFVGWREISVLGGLEGQITNYSTESLRDSSRQMKGFLTFD